MKTIYIVPIEPIDQRYTKQWYENIPRTLFSRVEEKCPGEWKITTIKGDQIKSKTTQGAFLDFGSTNIYKSSQVKRISKLFVSGKIKPGDKFLITDAWNFSITAIRYMSELMDIPVEIHSIWHAGAYDPTDILGYKMQKPWPHFQELAWFHASDYNYFATEFHKEMFLRNLNIGADFHHKAIRSGQPHDMILGPLCVLQSKAKQDVIMWPHRYNTDKQPEIAEDLKSTFNIMITQKYNFSKEEYYHSMGDACAIFSCALHENLGISVMEATLTGAIPLVPNRASYQEMYLECFKYPSEWTENLQSYYKHRKELVSFIEERVNNRQQYLPMLADQQKILIERYLNANTMFDNILST